MKIKWLGHSCFQITSNEGIRLLTDPFDEKVGYPSPSVEADIVTVSHEHYDHSCSSVVRGDFSLLNKLGDYNERGIEIKGILTYHDTEQGAKRGENIVFIFEIDGMKICHCGDLGHVLSKDQVSCVGQIDILLIPVGGTYTIDSKEAFKVMKQLSPKVTIPMHFRTDALSFPLDGVDGFLKVAGTGEYAGMQEVEVTKESIQEVSRVLVLDYK